MRAALAELDPTVPLSRVRIAAEWAGGSLAGRRFQSMLLAGFAALATTLAAAGLFGLLHEAVTQRRRELGIRLALGAAPGALVRLVMTHAIGLLVAGVLLGTAGAALLGGAVDALLYGVGATDPTTLATVAAALVVVGLVAAAVPARRAVRIQPAETLVRD